MTEPRPRKPIVMKRIVAPKPHDVLADQLREDLLRGDISEGAALPPERATALDATTIPLSDDN